MEKKKSNHSERSYCCSAKVKVVGKTTLHYECLKCGNPCDVYFKLRKTTQIRLATKIKGDERAKLIDKIVKEDYDE